MGRNKGNGGGTVPILDDDDEIQPSDLDTGTMVIMDDLDDDDDSGTMKRMFFNLSCIRASLEYLAHSLFCFIYTCMYCQFVSVLLCQTHGH